MDVSLRGETGIREKENEWGRKGRIRNGTR